MKFGDPAGGPLLEAVYDDGDDVIVPFARWLAETPRPDDWHRFALGANWDFVPSALFEWILLQDDCEKTTALVLFWKCQPDYYLEFEGNPDRVPDLARDGFDLLTLIRERWKAGAYQRDGLAFDVATDLWPMNFAAVDAQFGTRALEEIPSSMRESLAGRRLDSGGLIEGIPERFWQQD